MSAALVVGVPLALVAAACYNVAPVLQSTAARREPTTSGLGFALLTQLLGNRLWLAGIGCEVAGFVLEAAALSILTITLVAPLLASGVVLLVLLARRRLGERLRRRELAALVATVGGAAALVVELHAHAVPAEPATTGELWAVATVAAAATSLLLAVLLLGPPDPRVVGAAAGVAAGVCYGVATVCTRQVGLLGGDRHWVRLMESPAPYLLAGFSVVAIAVLQRGFQHGAVVIVYPLCDSLAAVIPVALGIGLLGEPLPGGLTLVAFVVTSLVVGGGLVALSSARPLVELLAASREPASAESEDGRRPAR